VISNFNLSLQKGDKVLLLGESGSGKSTLLKLPIGLYRPSKGHIYYNDRDLRELELKNVRQKIGFISQDIFLFNKSIRDNIIFNDPLADDQNILAVLDKCRIKNKVLSLKMGLDHVVSERGGDFSGGEKQRLSLARALIKQPDVILLDEALANVDAKTEEEVERIILDVFKDKIIIKISHHQTSDRTVWKHFSLKGEVSRLHPSRRLAS
jgi:ABC-type bacteriocin/lantibiotic exporter with double-glycine peptidase domain